MRTYNVSLNNGYQLTLPIVDVGRGQAIALLMINDTPSVTLDIIIRGLVEVVRPLEPDAIIGVPEQGVLLAHCVARDLGHVRPYILRKTPKVFDDAFIATYQSVTKGQQRLLMPKAWAGELSGKRVVIVEDVVCTGGTLRGVLRLLEKVNQWLALNKQDKILLVGIRVVLTETYNWEKNLGDNKHLVKGLGYIPMFSPVDYTAIK